MSQLASPRPDAAVLSGAASNDRELLRLHRRACTDFAARMRLPAWEHLSMPLASPLEGFTVADLLRQVADGNMAAAAQMSGQPAPPPIEMASAGDSGTGGLGMRERPDVTASVVESIRTVLSVAAGLDAGAGFSPRLRNLLWTRVVELAVLGYDLQQAISAGTGLDELLTDRIVAVAPAVSTWPGLEPLPVDLATPPAHRLLANAGRPVGRWVDGSGTSTDCSTGQC